jgi:hypothetical protein
VVPRKFTLPLILLASTSLALPGAAAAADPVGPIAHSAGGGAPVMNPAVVGPAITRTDKALGAAADSIDQGDGASAVGPLTAARRYLNRSYNGARYLIAHPPAAPAEEGRASAASFRAQAQSLVRASRRSRQAGSRWIRAHAADDPVGPVIADNPTAVFNVLTSQYSAATAAVAMYDDTTGALQDKVGLVLNSSIILRNRLVKAVAAAEPPAPAEEGTAQAQASQDEDAPTYATVMPGLVVLINDEIQQMQAAVEALPADAQADIQKALAADQQISQQVNTLWPAVAEG